MNLILISTLKPECQLPLLGKVTGVMLHIFVSMFKVIVKNLSSGTRVVLKSHYGYEVRILTLY